MNVSNFFISSIQQIQYGTAFKILSDKTLSGASATLDSGVIDTSGYTYLRVIAMWDTASGNSHVYIKLNHDASQLYGWTTEEITAAGASAIAAGHNTTAIRCTESGVLKDGMITADIQNISGSVKNVVGRFLTSDVSGGDEYASRCAWFNGIYNKTTTTLNQIEVYVSGETFPAGSRLLIMGV